MAPSPCGKVVFLHFNGIINEHLLTASMASMPYNVLYTHVNNMYLWDLWVDPSHCGKLVILTTDSGFLPMAIKLVCMRVAVCALRLTSCVCPHDANLPYITLSARFCHLSALSRFYFYFVIKSVYVSMYVRMHVFNRTACSHYPLSILQEGRMYVCIYLCMHVSTYVCV